MRLKGVAIGIVLVVIGASLIISIQNNLIPTTYDVADAETLGLRAISECMQMSSNLSENSICFNEKINRLETKFPSIKSELRKLGFVLKDDSSPDLSKFSNVPDNQSIKFSSKMIKIDDTMLEVQIADTNAKRIEGLQFQEKLPYDQGMLFDYTEPKVISMWMPNMKFSLDMIWFDEGGKVVYIEQDVEPCQSIKVCPSINANGQKAKYVLEVTSGFVDKFNITNDSLLSLNPE